MSRRKHYYENNGQKHDVIRRGSGQEHVFVANREKRGEGSKNPNFDTTSLIDIPFRKFEKLRGKVS
jgi:hypothetical protein